MIADYQQLQDVEQQMEIMTKQVREMRERL
jgi:hypothetical protein